MMPFFAPLMLFGLLAAAVPILLHLFRKRTARRIVWGAWQFLAESMRRKRRKILLEEILLLVVRTAILALAAIAFARPFLPEMGFFGGGDKDVVLVMDGSGSMNLKRADGTSAFDEAIDEARELVDRAPRGVSFGLVFGGRDAEILTATPLGSKRDVLNLLDDLKAGDGTMDVPRALEAAGGILSGGSRLTKEVVIFGDGQGYGWHPEDVNAWRRVAKVFSTFNRRPPVVWRTLERPAHVKNAAISSVVPSREIFGTDRPVTFDVTVVNSGSVAFSPGELALAVDGARVASQPVGQILPGLSRTIPFSCSFTKPGRHAVVASLAGGDDISSDNIVSNAVTVIDELKVLLVDGRPGSIGFERPSAFIETALRPERKNDKTPFLVRSRNVRPLELEATNVFSDVAVTVLCDVPFLSDKAAENLARWTSAGGGLLAVPGERVDPAFYTNWTWRGKTVLPAKWTKFGRVSLDTKPPLFMGAPVIGRMPFDGATVPGDTPADTARFSDGEPAVVRGTFGRGHIALLAMPLDLTWTGLPARPGFVPFVHELVSSLSAARSFVASPTLSWSAREGDVSSLTANETDAVLTHIDLSLARGKEDALAAVAGRGFGVEIWRPIAIFVLLLMIAEILLCRIIDRSRGGDVPPSYLRLFLRVISILALVWMLSHFIWVHDRTRKISRTVAVIVDQSLSMRQIDSSAEGTRGARSRLDLATNVAARLEAAFGERYDIIGSTFGAETTDFAAALEDVRARVPAEELAGAVFVTDGRPTAGADVDAIARLYARHGAKISSVIVGSVTNRPDLAIQTVDVPEDLFLGENVHALVVLRSDKLKGAKAVVKFLRGNEELGRESITIDADVWTKELRFTDTPKEKGVYRYSLVLETPEGDCTRENDVWPFDVAVSDDRTNVLIAERRPRWEFRYLRNLFYGRDKSVHLQYLLTEPDRLDGAVATPLAAADATRSFGDAEAGSLPSGRDAWRKFDVMVFGDLDPALLTEREVADIRACVEERGATAIFVSGGTFMPLGYAQHPLAELLPVVMTNAKGRVTAEWRSGSFPFAVTGAGHAHEIMSLSASDAENRRIWELGCDWHRRLEGLTVKPGAETLAFAGDSSALTSPLLIVQHRGRGRIVFLASDETWRLRYRIGDTYHHRFWGNVLRWGAGAKLRDGNAFARVGTDRLHYAPGGRVKIRVRLKGEDLLPLEGLTVLCTVIGPDGEHRKFPLASGNLVNGVYAADFTETSCMGDYRVEISCPEAARALGEKWPTKLETGFSVKTSFAPVEYANLSSDGALADELSALTGGEVLMLGNLEEPLFTPSAETNGVSATKAPRVDRLALDAFGAGRCEVVDRVESHIWDHPLVFIVLVLALSLVWILRKRKGLS